MKKKQQLGGGKCPYNAVQCVEGEGEAACAEWLPVPVDSWQARLQAAVGKQAGFPLPTSLTVLVSPTVAILFQMLKA